MPSEPLDYRAPVAQARVPLGRAAILVPLVGAVLGAALWAMSPAVTGELEAWDHFAYYMAGLFVSGLIAACFGPRAFWLAPVGVFAGQFIYAATQLPSGPLWPIGLALCAALSSVSLLGAVVPYLLHRFARENVA